MRHPPARWPPSPESTLRPLQVALLLATLLAGAALARAAAPAALLAVDDDQRTLALAAPAQRIVSLAPGATAMLFAAGAGGRVVGVSAYSDEPEAARALPRVGDSHRYDLERILALRPDVVVVWSGGMAAAQIEHLERQGLRVYRHRLRRLDDIGPSLVRLGILAGTADAARAAAASAGQRLAALRRRYATGGGHRLLIQVWDQPLYTVGGAELLSDVISTCGETNIYADLPDAGPAVSLESVLERNPEVILTLGSDAASAAAWAARWQAYPSLAAVRAGQVLAWSDPRLSRLGPSMIDAAEALCRALPH